MCQILISLDNPNANDLLETLFKQSYPTFLSYGHGILHQNSNVWSSYKNFKPPFLDETYKNMTISTNVIAHMRQIYTTNLTPHQIRNEHTMQNTQPYKYQNTFFMHHGDLFRTDSGKPFIFQTNYNQPAFKLHIDRLRSLIDTKLLQNIHGNTDSELMFHVFLHFFTLSHTPISNYRNSIASSLRKTFTALHKHGFQTASNIIIAHDNYIAFSNIYINNTDKLIKPLRLYIDKRNGINICSSKLIPGSVEVKQNVLYIYNIISKRITLHNMQI